MSKIYDYLIIDLQNLYARNYFTHEDMKTDIDSEVKVGGIFGTLISIRKLIKEFLVDDGVIYFLADNPSSKVQERVLKDPDYKINRIPRPRNYYRGLEILSLILQSYRDNCFFLQVPFLEADDLVPVIIDRIPLSKKIILCSTDMDWARAINYKGHYADWYNGKEIVLTKDFQDKYGFSPTEENVINFKTYRGDSSDNIESGIPNISSTLIFKLMEYGSVQDVIRDVDILDFLTPHWKAVIKERTPRIKLNYDLVSFCKLTYEGIKSNIIACKYKPRTLFTLYEGLGFDINKIDTRIVEYSNEKKLLNKGRSPADPFFIQPRIKRV